MKKRNIILILIILASISYTTAAEGTHDSFIICGQVNLNETYPNGLQVSLENLNTSDILHTTTATDSNATPGTYQFNMASFETGWEYGNQLRLFVTEDWGVQTITGERIFSVENSTAGTIMQQNLTLNMTEAENITLEDIYLLLVDLNDDVDSLEEDVDTIKTDVSTIKGEMEDIKVRLGYINNTANELQLRLGYTNPSDEVESVYNDLTEILIGLTYSVEENGTTWTVDKVLQNQTVYYQELLTLFGNGSQNISTDLILEKISELENTTEDIFSLNTRMFGKINSTISKENTIITKLDNTQTTANEIKNTVSNLDSNDEVLDSIEANVSQQNESLSSMQEKVDGVSKDVQDTQGSLGTITIILIIVAIVVIGLLCIVIKDYVEEILHEKLG